MEFVGNKKIACFCDSEKCSGLIGEKPKEPEKRVSLFKKKLKRKPSTIKTVAPEPRKELRTFEDMLDPFQSLLEKMPHRSSRTSIKREMAKIESAVNITNAMKEKVLDTATVSVITVINEQKMIVEEEDATTSSIVDIAVEAQVEVENEIEIKEESFGMNGTEMDVQPF